MKRRWTAIDGILAVLIALMIGGMFLIPSRSASSRPSAFACGAGIAGTLLLAAIAWFAVTRLARRAATDSNRIGDRCTECGYLLYGLASERCPECGTPIAARYRTTEAIKVTCWWWYDTVAILSDYSDCAEAVLEAGRHFTLRDTMEDDPTRLLCELDDSSELETRLVPVEHRNWKRWVLGGYVGFCVEISAKQLAQSCERLRNEFQGASLC